MRILHTADWHLNDRLGRIDRSDDLRAAVERVADHCREQQVDTLIVAGDLFSELARPDALRESIHHWQEVFGEFLERGGTILTCTGNHDNENFCQTLRHAMALAAPTVDRLGELVPTGRLYLAAEPTFLRLPDKAGGDVQFMLMPYPTPTRYLRTEGGQKYANPDEKIKLLVTAFENTIQDMRGHPKYRPDGPNVLIGHANVFGAVVGESLFRISPQEDVVVSGEKFADQFEYVALGHIHKEQFLGHEHIRYSGSIEKMDLGESRDVKSLTVFDLPAEGKAREITLLPMPSTPVYELSILDPTADLPRLKAEYDGAERDLVNLHIRYTAGQHNLEEVLRELEAIFPRWYARDWQETSQVGPTLVTGEADRSKSFGETVRDYLEQELMNHADDEKAELLMLADELISQCE
jgi:exonuclease SbcD